MNDQPLDEYVVVSDVPLPVPAPSKYPFGKMAVGDSFTVADIGKNVHNVRIAAHNYGYKHKVKFISRVRGDVCRVWRIK